MRLRVSSALIQLQPATKPGSSLIFRKGTHILRVLMGKSKRINYIKINGIHKKDYLRSVKIFDVEIILFVYSMDFME